MSYDRRRLRGHHPAACTCVDCKEGRRRRLLGSTPAKSENSVWPPRSLSPKLPHPTDCSCSECQEKRRRTRQRPGPAISPASSPQQEAAEQEGAQATEQQEPAQKEQEQQRQIQQTPATLPGADTAHVAPPRVQPSRARSPSRRRRTGRRRISPKTLLKFAMPLLLVALLVAGALWWTAGSSPGSRSVTQVTESIGGWFSSDCDNDRRRRRGGWARALFC